MEQFNQQFKNPLEEAPTDGIFNLHGEQLQKIKDAVSDDHKLIEYYKIVKEQLIKESGLQAIHRGQILNRMYEILSTGGIIEKELAKKLEAIAKIAAIS